LDQAFINWVIGFTGTIFGILLKIVWDAIVILKKDLSTLENKIHDDFVRREDFKDVVSDMKSEMRNGFGTVNSTLALIFKKLDSKEDK
jgi:hypothetical protein